MVGSDGFRQDPRWIASSDNRGGRPASVTADLTDALVDDALPGAVRDLPVVGVLVGLLRTGVSVRDYDFARKVARFLGELASVPEDQRREFIGEMHADPEKAQEVGEHLILVLDRLDDLAKAILLARAFKAYLLRRIDRRLFERLASALDRAPKSSLIRLASFYSSEPPPPGKEIAAGFDELQDLAIAGLVRMEFGGGYGGGAGRFVHNDLGSAFVKFVLQAA
jgi:hypothetical protein